MNCLFCDVKMMPAVTWENLLFFKEPDVLCPSCKGKLQDLKGSRCNQCSRVISDHIPVCPDCRKWEEHFGGEDVLAWNVSIYQYNAFMKDILNKWKYRGDYELGNSFASVFKDTYHMHVSFLGSDIQVVPIPLSSSRMKERGFNQAGMLADFTGKKPVLSLRRQSDEKQSKKSRHQRLASDNPFQVLEPMHKPVLLIDDLYTTGTTLRHAATVLKDSGCPQVYGLTLIRS